MVDYNYFSKSLEALSSIFEGNQVVTTRFFLALGFAITFIKSCNAMASYIIFVTGKTWSQTRIERVPKKMSRIQLQVPSSLWLLFFQVQRDLDLSTIVHIGVCKTRVIG
jgi:hypothetical protein